ncbi:MFS transporter, partial [Chloroflexota bacterium]
LFLTYSLLLAMGTGALFVVPMSIVAKWFERKRGLALGITSAGCGLGPVFMAPFATYLIVSLDWRMAYLVMGLMAWLILIPLSRFLRKDPYEIGLLPDGVKASSSESGLEERVSRPSGLSLLQALRTRSFWLIAPVWLLWAAIVFLTNTHIVPHATDIGFSVVEAALILSLMNGAAVVGRLLLGVASDRLGRKRTTAVCALFQCVAMLWLLWSQDLWMLYLFAVVYGFGWGGMSTTMAALIADTFGVGKLGIIFGVLEIGFGVGAAIGPLVGGFIFDISGSYFGAFLVGTVTMLVVTLLVVPVRREADRGLVS